MVLRCTKAGDSPHSGPLLQQVIMQHVTLFEVLIRAEVGIEGLIAALLRGAPIP